MAKNKRIIAFHLPQFYPFPENDEWWGKGFTEWRNVTKCKPRFKGHYQPHLPNDLVFYDLRLKECRLEQQKMAKDYGIDGFCYYHYWFNGHLLMEKPVEGHLYDKDETFPFMLCWANENWHRNWAGNQIYYLEMLLFYRCPYPCSDFCLFHLYSSNSHWLLYQICMPKETLVDSVNVKEGMLFDAFLYISNNFDYLKKQLSISKETYVPQAWNASEVICS